jgi:hypothetical protein
MEDKHVMLATCVKNKNSSKSLNFVSLDVKDLTASFSVSKFLIASTFILRLLFAYKLEERFLAMPCI